MPLYRRLSENVGCYPTSPYLNNFEHGHLEQLYRQPVISVYTGVKHGITTTWIQRSG